MKFSKGIINNINKKLLAGTLVLTLLTVPLAGCSDVSIDDIKYSKNEQGYIQGIDGTVCYETLNYCYFYNVYNNKTDERYYTIGLKDEFNGSYLIKYYDIFTGQELVYSDFVFKSIDSVENYLTKTDNIKEEYTLEELKEILYKFIETQEKSKQLVKE